MSTVSNSSAVHPPSTVHPPSMCSSTVPYDLRYPSPADKYFASFGLVTTTNTVRTSSQPITTKLMRSRIINYKKCSLLTGQPQTCNSSRIGSARCFYNSSRTCETGPLLSWLPTMYCGSRLTNNEAFRVPPTARKCGRQTSVRITARRPPNAWEARCSSLRQGEAVCTGSTF